MGAKGDLRKKGKEDGTRIGIRRGRPAIGASTCSGQLVGLVSTRYNLHLMDVWKRMGLHLFLPLLFFSLI